jgi:hypothetical protein
MSAFFITAFRCSVMVVGNSVAMLSHTFNTDSAYSKSFFRKPSIFLFPLMNYCNIFAWPANTMKEDEGEGGLLALLMLRLGKGYGDR